jgi:hypothetical protein
LKRAISSLVGAAGGASSGWRLRIELQAGELAVEGVEVDGAA